MGLVVRPDQVFPHEVHDGVTLLRRQGREAGHGGAIARGQHGVEAVRSAALGILPGILVQVAGGRIHGERIAAAIRTMAGGAMGGEQRPALLDHARIALGDERPVVGLPGCGGQGHGGMPGEVAAQAWAGDQPPDRQADGEQQAGQQVFRADGAGPGGIGRGGRVAHVSAGGHRGWRPRDGGRWRGRSRSGARSAGRRGARFRRNRSRRRARAGPRRAGSRWG